MKKKQGAGLSSMHCAYTVYILETPIGSIPICKHYLLAFLGHMLLHATSISYSF